LRTIKKRDIKLRDWGVLGRATGENSLMSEEYGKPTLAPIWFDFDNARLAPTEACMALSRTDVLGIVQSALDEFGPATERLVEVKREVLNEVAEGKLAHALRTAIVGAGKACCKCCA
jgi:hypothetical protein